MPSPVAGPQPYGGNKRSRTIMHARGVKLHKKSQERWGRTRDNQALWITTPRQVAGESSAGVSIIKEERRGEN